jgi:hypothetical protein
MTRRTVVDEPKYYDFEIALTVDPIWCEEDEDGPRIDYRGDIRKVEEEDVVGRVRFFVFHFDTTPWDPADAFDHISATAVYAQLLDDLEIEGSSKPDEFEQRMALDAMSGGTDMEVHKRLARYYRRAGFRSVKGTDHS